MGLLFEGSVTKQIEPWRQKIIDDLRNRHGGVHNLTVGLFESYFKLLHLSQPDIDYNGNVLVLNNLPGVNRTKSFVFRHNETHVPYLQALQRLGVVYSKDKLPLDKRVSFKETQYDLEQVLDQSSYANAKKRYERLRSPLQRLSKAGYVLRIATVADLNMIKMLHDEWITVKMADPNTVRIMLPKIRYYDAVKTALNDKDNYVVFCVFDDEERLVFVRSLYIEGTIAFDMTCIGAFWRSYHKAIEDATFLTMKVLRAQYRITTLNCGATLNKRLGAFKKHWPNTDIISYSYSRIK